jgi:osmotically-inducible protein OsmY
MLIRTARIAFLASVLGASTVVLTGCFPVVATGVVGGALSLADRRTTGAQAEDQAIELKAFNRFREAFKDNRVSLSVVSYNRIALLIGYVPDQASKDQAAKIASGIENVRTVFNEVVVGPPPSLRTFGSDTVLTTRVKASLVDAKDVQANIIKVYTESSTVFLMGIVTEREANRAADIASRVSGVRRVVRAFEIISEAELKRMQDRAVGTNTAPVQPASQSTLAPPPAASVPASAPASADTGGAVVTPIR